MDKLDDEPLKHLDSAGHQCGIDIQMRYGPGGSAGAAAHTDSERREPLNHGRDADVRIDGREHDHVGLNRGRDLQVPSGRYRIGKGPRVCMVQRQARPVVLQRVDTGRGQHPCLTTPLTPTIEFTCILPTFAHPLMFVRKST